MVSHEDDVGAAAHEGDEGLGFTGGRRGERSVSLCALHNIGPLSYP